MRFVSRIALAALVAGCGNNSEAPAESASAPVFAAPAPLKVAPPAENATDDDPNPLGLPPRSLDVAAGQKVFAPPQPMLRGAKVGSSLSLRVAQVIGKDGDDLLVDGRDGPSYKVHAGYVIAVPDGFRPRINGPVVAEWAGQLRHGVLRRWTLDSYVVRFTDTEDKRDRTLKNAAIVAQKDGLLPGNFAALKDGDTLRQVLLVSEIAGDPKRWLTLGFAGAIAIADEGALVPVPVSFEPKDGADVRAVWLGAFRPGTVRSTDRPGLFSVKFERAGRPVQLGWGWAMPPEVAPDAKKKAAKP